MDQLFTVKCGPHLLCDQDSRSLVSAGQDDRELLTSKPRSGILAFHVLGEQSPDQAQYEVTRLMAVGVVECLKPIDVHQQERKGAAVRLRPGQRSTQARVKTATVQ